MQILDAKFVRFQRFSFFNGQVSAYLRILHGALSAFSGVVEKAEELRKAELERLLEIDAKELVASGFVEELDDVLEMAASAGDDYLLHELGLMQGILNLFSVGMYHLFEQQIASIFKRIAISRERTAIPRKGFLNKRSFEMRDFVDTAAKHWGIDVKAFTSWHEIHELKHVANCAKHGDGDEEKDACNWLRANRPELLGEFAKIDENIGSPQMLGVTQPLFGEGLRVTEQDILRYGNAIRDFWKELEAALRRSTFNSPKKPRNGTIN